MLALRLGKTPDAEGVRPRRHAQPRRDTGVVVHHHRHARGPRDHARSGHPRRPRRARTPRTGRSTRPRCGPRCRPASSSTCCSRPTRCTTPPRSCGRWRRSSRPSRAATCSGILVKLTFGATPIVRLDLALIAQWGESVSNRLIVLGRLSSILPSESVRIVQLNLDAVGDLRPQRGHRRARRGARGLQAVRSLPADRRRRVPPGGRRQAASPSRSAASTRASRAPRVPRPARVTVALTNGDNPKLICQAYLAITANTVQFGAERVAVRRGVRLQHRGQRRLRRADPAVAAPLPGRVPGERAAQAGLDEPVQGLRRGGSWRARSRCGSAARRRSRSCGGTTRSASTAR